MINRIVFHHDFQQISWNPPDRRNQALDPQFLLTFRAKTAALDGVVISHPSGFSVTVADGRMEAEIRTEHDFRKYRIGFPLAQVEVGEHEFAVFFDGVRFQILCDGLVMDCDFPENPPVHIYDRDVCCELHSGNIKSLRFANDLAGLKKTAKKISIPGKIQYYTPYGGNTWAGDVTVCHYKGRFHIFYLHDRRHHGSRNGKGAHEFWHISSDDFVNWTDHGPVVEIKAPWQAVGTGSAFEFQGKLYLTYGLHTERAVPAHKHTKQLFVRNIAQYGHSGLLHMSEIGALLPHGSSYVSSDDGLNFSCSDMLMHYLVNPVVVPQEDGSLVLCQQGLWKSDHLGDWKLFDESFLPYYENSFARNCLDCPAFFKIGSWEYCIVGFTGFFGRENGSDKWIDFTEKGWDTYDGTNVPMTAWFNGKLIECGWLGGIGWGSCLVMREIIALGNGRLGKRWIEETLPEFGKAQEFIRFENIEKTGDWLFEFTVDPADGEFSVHFSGNGRECIFSLNPSAGRAQWSSLQEYVPSFREEVLTSPKKTIFSQFTYSPHQGHDYAKENMILPNGVFTVRILLHNAPKIGASVLDAEIAGVHTMATMRKEFTVSAVFTENIKNRVRKAGSSC